MLLQIGDLAKRTGLTIRTLHHYDNIGLLQPTARTEAGYRLYSRKDIARLHQILALRTLGMPLTKIGTALNNSNLTLGPLIDQQIEAIDKLIAKQTQLRYRLNNLKSQLMDGEDLDLHRSLKKKKLMSMYEKYFTKEELANLDFLQPDSKKQKEWKSLTKEANTLFNAGESPKSKSAQNLALRWMKTLEQNTNSNPEWLIKLNNLSSKEILFQEAIGVNDKIIDFLLEAFSESKLNIFENYLTEQEFSFMKQHYAKEMKSWPQLLVDLDKAIKLGIEPDSKHAKNLASKWIKMFQGYAGKDPNTHEKIRKAMHNEKSLAEGTWLKPEALMFLEKAVSALHNQ